MSNALSTAAALLVKSIAVMALTNELRGFVLAGPVLYAMYRGGGTAMALWLGFCSLAGIVLSVVVPMFVAKKVRLLIPRPSPVR